MEKRILINKRAVVGSNIYLRTKEKAIVISDNCKGNYKYLVEKENGELIFIKSADIASELIFSCDDSYDEFVKSINFLFKEGDILVEINEDPYESTIGEFSKVEYTTEYKETDYFIYYNKAYFILNNNPLVTYNKWNIYKAGDMRFATKKEIKDFKNKQNKGRE